MTVIQKNLFGEIVNVGIRKSLYSQAILLRLKHDPGRMRLERGEYKIKDVVDSLEAGFNFYNGEPIEID